MKRNLLLFCILALIAVRAQAQENGVNFFTGTWDELLKEAGRTGRPIFVDVYTDWCHWCKVMDRQTFADGAVGQYVSGNYLAYKLNAERGETNRKLSAQWRVTGYPTVVVLNYKGEPIGQIVGFKQGPEFINELKRFQPAGSRAGGPQGNGSRGGRPTTQDATPAGYQEMKNLAMQPLHEQLVALAGLTLDETMQALELGMRVDRFGFEDFMNQRTSQDALRRGLLAAHYELGRADYAALSITVEGLRAQGLAAGWLHYFAWQFFAADVQEMPAEPLRWVNDAIRAHNSYQAQDTKAALKFKQGKLDEAQQTAEAAIRLARIEGQDPARTELLVQLIRKGQRAQ